MAPSRSLALLAAAPLAEVDPVARRVVHHSSLPPPNRPRHVSRLRCAWSAPGVAVGPQVLDLRLQEFNRVPQTTVITLQQSGAVFGIA